MAKTYSIIVSASLKDAKDIRKFIMSKSSTNLFSFENDEGKEVQ